MAYLGTPIDTTNQFQSLQGKRFSGDGSTTAFTLDIAPSSVFDIEVFVENVRQDPNSAYSISGTTLTFTGAPSSGTNNIYVIHQAKAVGTIDVPASGVVPASLASNIISGQTELAAIPATTDELLISDAGTIKRIDFSLLGNAPAFAAKMSASQSISNDTSTKIAYNAEVYDTDSAYDHSSNYRFTVPSGKDGKYFIGASIRSGSITDQKKITMNLFVNGSEVQEHYAQVASSSGGEQYTIGVFKTFDLSAGDYIEVFVLHQSGGAVTFSSSSSLGAFFYGFRLIGI